MSQFVDVTYDATTQALAVNGISLQVGVAPGANVAIQNGTLSIAINTDGTNATGSGPGDLQISGDIDFDGDSVIDVSGLLLSGSIAQFGASNSGPGVFEFVFNITGGAFAGTLFPTPQAGVILGLDGNSTYTGSFASSFSNLLGGQAGTGTGSADTAPIPEPGTLLLLGAGFAGLAGFGRRERR